MSEMRKADCSGCRACEWNCPVHCITMQIDEEGFWYPVRDDTRCIQCGRCEQSCKNTKYVPNKMGFERRVYAAWNSNLQIRRRSSSGGIFHALACQVLEQGGVVYGASFTDDFRVEQRRIDKKEDIILLMGSKYVQSDVGRTYQQALEDLKDGKKVLYSGTPCQMRGLLAVTGRYAQNLLCVSVICHGVPSPAVWKRYLALKKGQYAETSIRDISFRDKAFGWRNFSTCIEFENRKYFEEHDRDLYMQGFLQNLFLRPSCYQCKAKAMPVYADIILGDYWGIETEVPELNTYEGISCVVVNTQKGFELWKEVQEKVNSQETTYDAVKKSNPMLEESVRENKNRKKFFEELELGGAVEEAIRNNLHMTTVTEEDLQLYQYTILYKYLVRRLSDNYLSETLHRIGLKKVVLYAVTDILRLLVIDIGKKKDEFNILISDRNFRRYGKEYMGLSVVDPHDLKKLEESGELDGIIICNPLRENDIIEELMDQGIEQKTLYSVTELIFD